MSLISCNGISKIYKMGEVEIKALKNISLEIHKSQFVSFIGPSGSGKTTILNLFGVLDKPTLGSVKVNGTDISKLNYVERAKFRGENLGFIFQNFNLIPVLTVFENVEYPLVMVKSLPKEERKKKVLSLLDEVGMLDQKDKMINQISGGQKQRAAIARALTTDPKIVFADEPTANLDHESAFKVMHLMKKLSREIGTTFIFSTHDPKIVKEVDIIYTLEDGALVNRQERGKDE
ncbi:ABC transporter ATP-binding protein [candidate division KSB1 bacterium]|nr:ABC transporter ATP-binding protein [candidate division KSB1 bacterium]MBL7087001.1 ABC transporter ATP-binding protein [Candidatus Cloacimonadota bacterium]